MKVEKKATYLGNKPNHGQRSCEFLDGSFISTSGGKWSINVRPMARFMYAAERKHFPGNVGKNNRVR